MEQMNAFIVKYLCEEWKSAPWPSLKAILWLFPILSLVGMFASVQLIPTLNQRLFLRNSTHEWVGYSDQKPVGPDFAFRVIGNQTVAHVISREGGVFFRPQTAIELFLVTEGEDPSWNKGYFNRRNVVSGELSHLTSSEGRVGLALSYDAAKRLNKGLGDKVSLIFRVLDDDGVRVVDHYGILEVILRPGNGGGGETDGVGVALIDSHFMNFLERHAISYDFAVFGSGAPSMSSFDRVVHKREQMAAATLPPFSEQYVVLIIALMGVMAIFLLIQREVAFFVDGKTRTIGILLALGATKHIVYKTIWIGQAINIAVASLLASFIYKHLLMERFIGEYIDVSVWAIILFLYIAIGLSSLQLAMRKALASIGQLQVSEIIAKKPEEL